MRLKINKKAASWKTKFSYFKISVHTHKRWVPYKNLKIEYLLKSTIFHFRSNRKILIFLLELISFHYTTMEIWKNPLVIN